MSGGDWKDLYSAASSGDLELVRFHLRGGIDPDYVHPEYQCTVLVAAIVNGHEDVALALLDAGADPKQYSELDELTPSQAAEQRGLATLVDCLSNRAAPARRRPRRQRPGR